jgi:hypothetical protein
VGKTGYDKCEVRIMMLNKVRSKALAVRSQHSPAQANLHTAKVLHEGFVINAKVEIGSPIMEQTFGEIN